MSKYLIEIGTEELPYKFISSAMEQLKSAFAKVLEENRITFKNITTYGTPRRLAVIVEDISESQPDLTKKIKGPPANVAMDANGNLTQAGIGFARKQGLNPEILYKENVGGIDYIFAEIKEQGRKTEEVLRDIAPEIILKLQGSHFMRWGDLEIKFSRPVRWIVSILDNKEVKIRIGNVESSSYSRGNRFYKNKEVKVNSPDTYLDDLYLAQVIVNPEKRREEVIKAAEKIAESINGSVHLDVDLVDEVTNIVEWPVPIVGNFDEKYLAIPKDVIVTVMASHQRYFPVFEKNSDKLLNCFITMANSETIDPDNVKAGNERVIKARLDDAIFFYTEDRKKTLESRLEDLKGVTFQKGLGSMYDKSFRIRDIAIVAAVNLNLDAETTKNIEEASLLCKADLLTNLVREFTELQGIIGSEYARLDGKNTQIVTGIREHYLPISADSGLAETLSGQIVGIADKIDTICGVFALGKAPTGSADPLGLRRAALGILLTIINKNININLSEILKVSVDMQPVEIPDKAKLVEEIREFIIQRLRIYLNEDYKYDIVEAVLGAKDPLLDIKDVVIRAEILSRLVKKENYSAFHEAANRIYRIIKSESITNSVNPSLFVQDIESQLWNCVMVIESNKVEYSELVKKLEDCIPVIEKYFEDVLVNDKDRNIRENRLAMMGFIKNRFFELADFSKIVL